MYCTQATAILYVVYNLNTISIIDLTFSVSIKVMSICRMHTLLYYSYTQVL